MTTRTPDPVPPTPEDPAFSASPHSARTTTPPPPAPHGWNPAGDRPLPRGERRAWNAATAVVGGVGALALLLGGAGTAAALALTQERDSSWSADSAVSALDIDAPTAAVDVSTSPTVDHVEVRWHETGWHLDEQQLTPTVEKGTLRLTVPPEQSGWGTSFRSISVLVPEKAPAAAVTFTGHTGAVSITGAFTTVSATTELGVVSAQDVQATVLDARATAGEVVLDGVRVRDRLDAHATTGTALVSTQGAAPKRASVTADTGFYGVDMPAADYWYPATSRHDFPNPRLPRTTSSEDGTTDSAGTGMAGSGGTDAATAVSGDGAPGADVQADAVCASAPKNRPCLFLRGEPLDVQDFGYADELGEAWQERTSPHESDDRSPGSPASGTSPSSPSASRSTSTPAASAPPTPARED
ncbi:DUF4097 family beta strand repeat-containing protein [Kocuria sp.]|uniref:DUF4097 family beta strand repeat-containing protein n=1 Tax=Kocuria sp. TaxID=1871328 RepID=UPI0026DCE5C0|nr:DUF4097 family beta strand repeat-containing protein [Kocuria sp.]MDO4918946.1 hypothetical protein [Kocuria sp.]